MTYLQLPVSVSKAQKNAWSFVLLQVKSSNILKTKMLAFGNPKEELRTKLSGTPTTEYINRYNCFGNVFNPIRAPVGGMFKQN